MKHSRKIHIGEFLHFCNFSICVSQSQLENSNNFLSLIQFPRVFVATVIIPLIEENSQELGEKHPDPINVAKSKGRNTVWCTVVSRYSPSEK